MSEIIVLGIDLAKNVFELCGLNRQGKSVYRKRVKRNQLLSTIANVDCERIVIEACGSSHYWAREFRKIGHSVELLPPQHVKPYVKGNKNDPNDARGIAIAGLLGDCPTVPVKTESQQAMLALHSSRRLLVKQRTALSNAIRGTLAEFGLAIPKGEKALRAQVESMLGETGVTEELLLVSLQTLYQLWQQVDEQVKGLDLKIQQAARASDQAKVLMAVAGIGPMTATAFISTLGDPQHFRNGRHVSAWLGMVPKHEASGDKKTLGGISKRGDVYLRYLLIHGARAALRAAARSDTPSRIMRWALALQERSNANVATVALASKNARILWSLMANGEEYRAAA